MQLSDNTGPLLLYDSNFEYFYIFKEGYRRFTKCSDEEIKKYIAQLLGALQKFRPELAKDFIQSLTRHKVDGKNYAIKKIYGSHSRDTLERAKNEVLTMSRLNNVNIVRYITSWLDYEWINVRNSVELMNEDYLSAHNQRNYLKENKKQSRGSKTDEHTGQEIVPCGSRESLSSSVSGKTNGSTLHPILCIQLELCQYNLADWIIHRNRLLQQQTFISDSLNNYLTRAPTRWLMDQIVSGVNYLHVENVLHRDLKPENILICGPPLNDMSIEPCACTSSFPFNRNKHWNRIVSTESRVESSQSSCISIQSKTSSPTSNQTCFVKCSTDVVTCQKVKFSTNRPCCYHNMVVKICDFGLARLFRPDNSLLFAKHDVMHWQSESLMDTCNESSDSVDCIYENNRQTTASSSSSSSSSSSPSSSSLASHLSSTSYDANSSFNSGLMGTSYSITSHELNYENVLSKQISDSFIEFKHPSTESLRSGNSNVNPQSELDIVQSTDPTPTSSFPFKSKKSCSKTWGKKDCNELVNSSRSTVFPKPCPHLFTTNLGSRIYAAPEINSHTSANLTVYNEKVDIFSMGVIFFEMLHPCHTKSELIHYLDKIHKYWSQTPKTKLSVLDLFPHTMQSTWPFEIKLVASMLSRCHEDRPTAAELLEKLSVNSEFPNLIAYRNSRHNYPSECNSPDSQPDMSNNSAISTLSLVHDDVQWSPYQLIEYLIWNNERLERELYETRRRLSFYENKDK